MREASVCCLHQQLDAGCRPVCPCCEECHNITSSSFALTADVVLKVLEALLVQCDKPLYTTVMARKHLNEHVDSDCQKYMATSSSPSKLTIQEISPPTAAEQKAAVNVVKRLMHTSSYTAGNSSSSPIVKLTTDGTVSNLHE